MNTEKRRFTPQQISPVYFILFSLTIITLLFFFVIQTLNRSIEMGKISAQKTTYAQYDRNERENAREAVAQLQGTLQYINKDSSRTTEKAKSDILSMLRQESTNRKSGDGIFIFDKDGICLYSHDFIDLIGYSVSDIKNEADIDFAPLFEELTKGGEERFIRYKIFSSARQKTAYITYFAPWEWIIGAGFYSDEADEMLQAQKGLWEEFGEKIRHTVIIRLLLFSSFLFLFILTVSIILRNSHAVQKRVQYNLRLYRNALEDNLCVMVTDEKGKINYINDLYCRLAGHNRADLIDEDFATDFYPMNRKSQRGGVLTVLKEGKTWNGVLMCQNTSGGLFWLQAQIKKLDDTSGKGEGFIAVALDITELQQTKTHLQNSIYIDSLTGCGNRAKLLADYDQLKKPLIAQYNVDHFSSINHFYGIERGDEVLTQIGNTLKSLLRGGESLYRSQADTFVIISRDDKKEKFIEQCRTRMFVLNNFSFDFDNAHIPISVRCGVSVSSRDALIIADSALAATKESSDGFLIYGDKELGDSRVKMEKVNKLNTIKLAMSNSSMFLTYQPIMDLSTGEINKYECLIRMKDDQGNTISPEDFIELAKEGRLYKKITHYVIKKAFYVFQNRPEEFSINLTVEDFTDRETIDLLIEQAHLCQVQNRLILEIVETEELRDFGGILKIINRLKEEGIRIAIDDFGSGFSNFTYLLKLNADFIKIDGSLTKNILEDPNSLSLVKSIIQFAQKAKIKTIAEYIETEELQNFAREIGIDFGQGYHIGKPTEWS